MAKDEQVSLVLTTLPGSVDGDRFGRTLVEERLAACVHIHGAGRSVYRWENQLVVEEEQSVTIKTTADLVLTLERRIGELHSYREPEILVITVSGGSASYLAWLKRSTQAASVLESKE